MQNNTQKRMHTDLSALLNKAETYIASGQLEAAASIYNQTLQFSPTDPNLHHTLGLVYLELSRPDRALFHINQAVELDPLCSKTLRSLGDALRASNQSVLAIAAYEKAYAMDPYNTDALLNLGTLFHNLDQFERARDAFNKIIEVSPDNVRALNNLGKLHHDLGQFKVARSYYDRCIDHQPNYAEARFNRAALMLAMGDYKYGWKEYEWRFKRSCAANVYPHQINTPLWKGESYRGRRLLVHCEQGMGDVLQFIRYLPLVKQRGGTLIMEAHPPLVSLLKPLPSIDKIITFSPAQPPAILYDIHIPLMSLPEIFNTETASVPDTIPYIRIDPDTAKPWQPHLKKNRINIGLFWSSSSLNPKRNLPIDRCSAWFQHPALHFIALQVGEDANLPHILRNQASSITELGHLLQNFQDTAAVMANLDVLISVDTAAAHLAGAMGVPLWLLLPFNADWRWSLFDHHNPWYPSAKEFRQPHWGDWKSVIAAVSTSLASLADNNRINSHFEKKFSLRDTDNRA